MPGEPFNLDQMRLVDLIDRHRSFTRAAAALGVTQSAVSQQVRIIEQGLGRRLFSRGGTGLSATPDGEAYLVYARAMLAIGDDAKRHFAADQASGEIRLGLTEDFARTALPAVLALFNRDHPRFAFLVECGSSASLFAGLDEDRHDVVVAKHGPGGRGAPPPGERLWSEPMSWYGREDTPNDLPDPLPLALIPAPSVSRQVILDTLRRAGRPWRLAFQSRSFGAIEAVVQAGIGISAFGQHFAAPGLVELGLEHGLPSLPPVDIRMARAPDPSGTTPDAMTAFCALIREAALLTAGQDREPDPRERDPGSPPAASSP